MTIQIAHVRSILTGQRRPVPKIKAEPKPAQPKKRPGRKPKPMPEPVAVPCDRAYTVGIYAVRHLESGQAYIGLSRDPMKRLASHRRALAAGRHPARSLQALWQDGAFSLEVLEEGVDANFGQAREQFWMWRFDGKLLNNTQHAWPDMAPGMRNSLKRGVL